MHVNMNRNLQNRRSWVSFQDIGSLWSHHICLNVNTVNNVRDTKWENVSSKAEKVTASFPYQQRRHRKIQNPWKAAAYHLSGIQALKINKQTRSMFSTTYKYLISEWDFFLYSLLFHQFFRGAFPISSPETGH